MEGGGTGGKRASRSELFFDCGCSLFGGIGSELPFLFILSIYKGQRSKGTQAWILLEIDFDEVIFIAIPEELIEFLDKVQQFPSRLDFLFIFHFSSSFC